MFKNYIKIAWRNIRQYRGYTILNIAGLAIGMAVFITTLLYVNYETGYDKWDPQLERVYRAGISETRNGAPSDQFWTSYPLGTQIATTCPEAVAVTRIIEQGEQLVSAGENKFYENRIIAADSSFFAVFPYRFSQGSAVSAMTQPASAVISHAMASKYFGNDDPVGKSIAIANAYRGSTTYTITGVIEKTGPSHLNFDICLSYFNKSPDLWGRKTFQTYVLMQPNASVKDLSTKATALYVNGEAAYVSSYSGQKAGSDAAAWLSKYQQSTAINVFFEPVAAIHLEPKASGWRDAAANHPILDFKPGNSMPVIFFSIAALLVLILACINYTNLSIARAGKRAGETGIRKVLGASRRQLIFLFLIEAFFHCLAALLAGLLLSKYMIGLLNQAFNLNLEMINPLDPAQNYTLVWQLLVVVLTVTVLSGTYPAFILSSFRPAKVLKGDLTKTVKGRLLRNSLVVLQFVISAVFLTGLLVVFLQLRYMRNNDPGFSTDQVLVLNPAKNNVISPGQEGDRLAYIKNQLLAIPGVAGVSAAGAYPGRPSMALQEAVCNGKTTELTFNYIHFDYFDVLKMPLIAGRNFSTSHSQDTVNNAIINEAAAKLLELDTPLGQQVQTMLRDYTIIGVLKDNHMGGYDAPVAPAIYAIGVQEGLIGGYSSLLVKLRGNEASKTATAVDQFWKTIEPDFPLRYTWLDQDFAKLFSDYERLGRITTLLAIVSTLIALMGIFTLSAYSAGQRTREIGIRKVFGASIAGITMMLSKDFMKLVLASLLIAIPLAYWGCYQWLQHFAYRIQLSWLIFACTGMLVILLALITVSVQSVKAAISNPVDSLRSE